MAATALSRAVGDQPCPIARADRDVATWLAARCIVQRGLVETAFELYFDYRDYADHWRTGLPLSASSFHHALDAHGFGPAYMLAQPGEAAGMVRPGLALVTRPIAACPPGSTAPKAVTLKLVDPGGALRRDLKRYRELVERADVALTAGRPIAPGETLAAEIAAAARAAR